MNPFSPSQQFEPSDQSLVKTILAGDKIALNQLIARHQPYIYNIAWKMLGNPDDAADLSQEALIKIISNLAKFNFNSSFRTWAYRIVRNHFLNDQKKKATAIATNFQALGEALDAIPNVELTTEEQAEKKAAVSEIRTTCLSGMLLCLTKEQRMIFIIGEMFGADHNIGSEIMEISKANYRMKLSKARKDLINFMQHKCGLVDKTNPCRCYKKVSISLKKGIIEAKQLLHNEKAFSSFRQELAPDANYLVEDSEVKYVEWHRENRFKTQFEKKNFLQQLLEDAEWKNRLNLN
ncbi:MAG: RNA polymerase sigma factor [Bacteroidota bacterium]